MRKCAQALIRAAVELNTSAKAGRAAGAASEENEARLRRAKILQPAGTAGLNRPTVSVGCSQAGSSPVIVPVLVAN